jgi:hypothetical protein
VVGLDAGGSRELGVPDQGHLPGGAVRPDRSLPWQKRAAVAIANTILVSAYHMLERDEPYRDLGPDWLEARHRDAHTRRLVAQLQCLDHVVVLDPAA